jgi:hypothetical protein
MNPVPDRLSVMTDSGVSPSDDRVAIDIAVAFIEFVLRRHPG